VKILRGVLIFCALLSFTGCATYTNKQTQKIEIRTSGVDNVNCYISNSTFQYELIAPGKIAVARTSEDYDVICSKAGYYEVHEKIRPQTMIGKATVGNVYNGVLPGLLYDIASNSMNEFPDMVMLKMERDPNRYMVARAEKYVLPEKDYDELAYLYDDKKEPSAEVKRQSADAYKAVYESVVK